MYRNISANFVSQVYVALIGVAMVPMYIKYMGAEAYGLVGFYLMLQAWFLLLDLGLTPALSREVAGYVEGKKVTIELRKLIRVMEFIFITMAGLGSAALILASNYISVEWLNIQQLSIKEVQQSVVLIALLIGVRLIVGMYRGVINGFEQFVWLASFNILMATARFVLVVPVLIYTEATPTVFFSYQLIVALIELVIFIAKTYKSMPAVVIEPEKNTEWNYIIKFAKFSMGISFTSVVWIAVTQTDKLLLSKYLTLTEYSYYTVAVIIAGGISMLTSPITIALLPRLSKISAHGDDVSFLKLYRESTRLVVIITLPIVLMLSFFAESILWVWTGDKVLSNVGAPVLTLYALGNGVSAIAAFPYYLQYAKGDLRLHVLGNAISTFFLLPCMIMSIMAFGMIGAGLTWLSSNIIYFMFWVPRVHKKFFIGLHRDWLIKDIGKNVFFASTVIALIKICVEFPSSRSLGGVYIVVTTLVLFLSVILFKKIKRFNPNEIKNE